MDATGDALGLLAFVLAVSAALTVPAAALLLWLYRRAVRREMNSAPPDQAGSPVAETTIHRAAGRAPIRILDHDAAPGESGLFHDAEQSLRRAVLLYALAGAAYALLFGIVWALRTTEGLHAWRRILWVSSCYFWPTVFAANLVAATSLRERLAVNGVYFLLLASSSVYAIAVSLSFSVRDVVTFWLIVNLPPTVLMLVFLRRRVRAVGPLILTFALVAVLGSQLGLSLLATNERWMNSISEAGAAVGLGGDADFWVLVAAGLVFSGFLGWKLLRRFGELYRRKRFSDQSLMLDSLYLFFALTQGIFQGSGGKRYMLAGPAGFLAYKAITWAGFRYWGARRPAALAAGPVLLILRVFSLGERSERLFDALSKRWRRAGSVTLIAGPDLVRTVLEPHEFLDFVGGKMSRRFVTGAADLAERIAALDCDPDPDGRYRVNQFFCRLHTWQMTMRRLVQESSVVLMDLRSFSPRNRGCVYELRQILNSTDLRRVRFVVDATTDRRFLEETLQQIWQETPADSPNAAVAEPAARLFVVRDESAAEVRSLLRELLVCAERSDMLAARRSA